MPALRRAARVVTLRWGVAALLAGSALLLMLAPRADQPLLDAAEYAVPSLRTLYLTATEAATYEDARRYAERYREEAERLNAIETKSRAQGEAIPDDDRAPRCRRSCVPTARCGAARNSSCARCARAPASGCAGSPGR